MLLARQRRQSVSNTMFKEVVPMRFASILILFCALTACAEDANQSWRFPVESDRTEDWSLHTDEPFHVEADFDGNGVIDDVWIVVEKSGEGWRLIALMNGSSKALPLTASASGQAQWFGLREVAPGTLKTACGKGYWECSEDEPPVLNLANPAVAFFKFESASTLYYWSDSESAFKSIAESD